MANVNLPTDVALDSHGNLFIASYLAIRKVATDGTISTVLPELRDVSSLEFDNDDNLYAGGTNTVKKITPEGVITIVAGKDG